MREPRTRWVAALAVTGALLALPACASSVDPIERLGRKAAERVHPRPSPVQRVRAAVDAKRCEEARTPRTDTPVAGPAVTPVAGPAVTPALTPRSDELALRLTEC
ncbi:hypothetical protein ABZ926_28750 [Streptomyces litmocidini]|uniref:hypothetical protein n=1 Tax=Streptomyces litmocidini TaxID=67318 RepID=UPI0033C9030B